MTAGHLAALASMPGWRPWRLANIASRASAGTRKLLGQKLSLVLLCRYYCVASLALRWHESSSSGRWASSVWPAKLQCWHSAPVGAARLRSRCTSGCLSVGVACCLTVGRPRGMDTGAMAAMASMAVVGNLGRLGGVGSANRQLLSISPCVALATTFGARCFSSLTMRIVRQMRPHSDTTSDEAFRGSRQRPLLPATTQLPCHRHSMCVCKRWSTSIDRLLVLSPLGHCLQVPSTLARRRRKPGPLSQLKPAQACSGLPRRRR
jgi:hypothetical protein